MQAKSSIVKRLSAVQVETVERIQQISKVIAETVSVVGEVTAEAQVIFFSHLFFSYTLNFSNQLSKLNFDQEKVEFSLNDSL